MDKFVAVAPKTIKSTGDFVSELKQVSGVAIKDDSYPFVDLESSSEAVGKVAEIVRKHGFEMESTPKPTLMEPISKKRMLGD